MFIFKLKLYLRMLIACWFTFGISKSLLHLILFKPLFNLFNSAAYRLDYIFFPKFRNILIKKPIFIIGHPRSGSTFLHRVLHQTSEFVHFKNWEIILNSLVARKILAPLVEIAINKKKNVILPKAAGHEQLLESIEEEELLLYRLMNTQFLAVYTPLGFSASGFDELVYADQQPSHVRRATVSYLKGCFQRQIYHLKTEQILANMNYSGMRIRTLIEEFPDAKFIYLIRTPYETIPSHLSLDRNVLDHLWGLDNIPANLIDSYFEHRYRYDVAYYQYIERLFEEGVLNSSSCLILSYDTIRTDLRGAIAAIVDFTGIELSDAFQTQFEAQLESHKNYRPEHVNLSLTDFGLSKAQIYSDLSLIFNKYGFSK